MRDVEWDNIQEGDHLDYLPLPSKQERNPTPRRYMVYQLIEGRVQAMRPLKNHHDDGTLFSQNEIVVISKNSDRWTYVSVKGKIVATGGFIVTRAADGHANPEYQKCPTDLERSLKPSRKSTEPV